MIMKRMVLLQSLQKFPSQSDWLLGRITLPLSRVWGAQRIHPLVCPHWIVSYPRYKYLPRNLLTKLVCTILLLRNRKPAWATCYKQQKLRNDWRTTTQKTIGPRKVTWWKIYWKTIRNDKIPSISYGGTWLDGILYTWYWILSYEYKVYDNNLGSIRNMEDWTWSARKSEI